MGDWLEDFADAVRGPEFIDYMAECGWDSTDEKIRMVSRFSFGELSPHSCPAAFLVDAMDSTEKYWSGFLDVMSSEERSPNDVVSHMRELYDIAGVTPWWKRGASFSAL